MSFLTAKKCAPCEGLMAALAPDVVQRLLEEVPDWHLVEGPAIERTFAFDNYYQTMAFVNAVAWIAHCEDHHPDLSVHYNRCVVRYQTHAVNGLTENDFICARAVSEIDNRDRSLA